eukprot:COSAG01_NODE_21429_length_902_cov_2.334994_2_plen_28_part_01
MEPAAALAEQELSPTEFDAQVPRLCERD